MIGIKVNLIFDYITVKITVSMFFGMRQGCARITVKILRYRQRNTVRSSSGLNCLSCSNHSSGLQEFKDVCGKSGSNGNHTGWWQKPKDGVK